MSTISETTIADVFRTDGPLEIALEFGVIWLGVYGVFRFLRGTRGAGVVKGFFLVAVALTLVIRIFGDATDGFSRLRFLFDRAFSLLAILLVVVFQPELRAAMGRLGRAQIFTTRRAQVKGLADEIARRRRSRASSGRTRRCTTSRSSSATAGSGAPACSCRSLRKDRSQAPSGPAIVRPSASPMTTTASPSS